MKSYKAWVARDEDGMLFLYLSKPIKYEGRWIPTCHRFTIMNEELFPEVKWEDEEPKKIELSIRNNMENSKIKSALSFLCRFSLFVFILSCTVLGLLHVIKWIIRQTFLT